jgi:hypothetical protein
MLEALVQPPKDIEDEDPVVNRCVEVSQTVSHGLELTVVLIDREVTLNKSRGPPGEDPSRWSC